ncbi:hypothetical protein Trco_007308 [Trichoderma cornu-damae]|uniref:Uncharacterized protein n=1 Tax=Trichoderma cornu-damae TaxID=654480 RepID=A0A9P8TTB6_9HYPO|nr:hypothetical protein Trco_007308 [Trichoderma cornu-damae]
MPSESRKPGRVLLKLRRCTQPCQDNDHALTELLGSQLDYAAAPSPARITTMPIKILSGYRGPCIWVLEIVIA